MKRISLELFKEQNPKNIEMKNLNVLMVLAIIIFSSTIVNAKEIGNITVYVKDQNGDNVADPSGCLGGCWNLADDLVVELWYDGEMEDSQIFQKDNGSLIFTVNHTGPYIVRAIATLKFIDEKDCYTGKRGYDVPQGTEKCENVCKGQAYRGWGDEIIRSGNASDS